MDKKKVLYDTLSKDFDLGDYDSFVKDLEDANSRKRLYDAARSDYNLGDYDVFENKLGYNSKSPVPSLPEQPAHNFDAGSYQSPTDKADDFINQAETFGQQAGNLQRITKENRDDLKKKVGVAKEYVNEIGRDQIEKDMAKEDAFRREHPFLSALMGVRGPNGPIDLPSSDMQTVSAAANKVRDMAATIEEAEKKGNTNFFAGAVRGMGEKLSDIRTWDSGVLEGLNNNALLEAVRQSDKDMAAFFDTDEYIDTRTKGQNALLDVAALEGAVNDAFAGDLGRGYKAGKVTAESLPFMIQMATNPAGTTGRAMGIEVAKRFGKEGIKTIGYKAAKIGARAIGDVAGAAIMTGTTGVPAVMADATRRQVGNVIPSDEGYSGRIEAVDYGEALVKAYGSQTIENYSEMFGAYFSPMKKIAGAATSGVMNKIGLGKVNELLKGLNTSDMARIVNDITKQTQWNGMFEEYAEEVVGMVLNNVLIGDTTNEDLVSLDQHIDTFLGVSLMGGAISALKIGGYRTPKYNAKKALNIADKEASSIEGWEGLRNLLDTADDEKVKEILLALPEESQAPAYRYASALYKYRGVNVTDVARREDGAVNPEDASIEDAFEVGVETASNDAKAKRMLRKAYEDIMAETPAGLVEFANKIESGEASWDLLNDDDKAEVEQYLSAKSAYEGLIQGVQDKIDNQINEAVRQTQEQINPDMDALVTVELKNGTQVQVLGGTIASLVDGSIDKDKSTPIVIEENGVRMVIPAKDIQSIISNVPSQEAIERVKAEVELSASELEASEIEDEVLPSPFDDITLDDFTQANEVNPQIAMMDEVGNTEIAKKQAELSIKYLNGEISARDMLVNNLYEYSGEATDERLQQEADRLSEYWAKRFPNLITGTKSGDMSASGAEAVQAESEQDGPVAEGDREGAPVAENDTEGAPTFDVNSLPKKKDGSLDYAQFTPEQRFRYTESVDGTDVAIEDLTTDIEATQVEIEAIKGKIVKATGSERIVLRENLKAKETELSELASLLPYNMPQKEAQNDSETGAGNDVLPQDNVSTESNEAPKIPVDKEGNVDYKAIADVDMYAEALRSEFEEEDALEIVSNNLTSLDGETKGLTKIKDVVARKRAEKKIKEKIQFFEDVRANIQTKEIAPVTAEQKKADKAVIENEIADNITQFPNITERWEKSSKHIGNKDEIILPNGEKVAGTYVLTSAFAPTPSHDPFNNFAKSEGFPVTDNGKTINDRDYEADKNAQIQVEQRAGIYDQRALQTPVIVSNDGVVISGNDRTMSGQLAAQRGTDNAYNDYLLNNAGKYGFTPEQVATISSPRVVFVPDETPSYSTETFAKFNKEDKKTQNKTEKAVAHSKTLKPETIGKLARIMDDYDTLDKMYDNPRAVKEIVSALQRDGVIGTNEIADMIDGDILSGSGRDFVENLVIGGILGEKAIRQLNGMRDVRQTIVKSATHLVSNKKLGDYSLSEEINDAIDLVYNARKQGMRPGETVDMFMRTQSMFDESPIDLYGETVQMLANTINKGQSFFKKVVTSYNERGLNASTGQSDIFTGEVEGKDEIIKDALKLFGYEQGTRTAKTERAGTEETGNSEKETGNAETSDEGSGTEVNSAIASAEANVDTNPTQAQKEAGNYRMGHVEIDGHNITIENPKGSVRSGVDASGKEWSVEMNYTYGYIKGTKGKDGDHIDIFLSDNPTNGNVFVVDQVNKDGSFDEHKVMYGFESIDDAREAYMSNYEKGWTGLGNITEVSKENFGNWLASGTRKMKPFAEYKSTKAESSVLPEKVTLSKRDFQDYAKGYYKSGGDRSAYDLFVKATRGETGTHIGKGVIAFANQLVEKNPNKMNDKAFTDLIDKMKRFGEYEIAKSKQAEESDLLFRENEEPRELIALHNLDEANLMHAKELGGLAVPSVAITKAEFGMKGFGDITMILPKKAVDPSGNPTFSADAYTATHPARKAKLNAKKTAALSKDVQTKARTFPMSGSSYHPVSSLSSEFAYQLEKDLSENNVDDLKEYTSKTRRWMAAYALINGIKIPSFFKPNKVRFFMVDYDVNMFPELYQKAKLFVEKYNLKDGYPADLSPVLSEATTLFKHALEERCRVLEISEETAQRLRRRFQANAIDESGNIIFGYLNNLVDSVNRSIRSEKSGESEYDQSAFDAWLDDKFSSASMKKKLSEWISNVAAETQESFYFEDGKKKVPYTIENITDYMKASKVHGTQKTMVYGFGNSRSELAKQFDSFEDIKSEADKLTNADEYKGLREDLNNEATQMATDLMRYSINDGWDSMSNFFRAIAESGKGAEKALSSNGFKKVPANKVKDFMSLVEKIKDMKVPYFESKPQRTVQISEFRGAVIPKTASKETIEYLKSQGVEVVKYDPSKEGDKVEKTRKLALKLDKKEQDILFREENKTDTQIKEEYTQAANELASELGIEIEILSKEDLPDGHKRAQGYFNPRTGKIAVCPENHASVEDVRRTIFHEAVAHKGLRGLFGKEFDNFLDKTYQDASEAVRRRINTMASRNGWNVRVATEEYLANQAETGFDDNLFSTVKQLFNGMISKAKKALGFKLSDADIKYVLWKSYRNLKGKGSSVFDVAEDVAMKYRLFREGAEEAKIISDSKKNGTYMKAPNGKPTNLTEKQWVQVRTQAFKDWFGDWQNGAPSKMIDKNGEPMIAYHGTPKYGFNVFKENPFFTADEEYAKVYASRANLEESLYRVFLKVDKPFDIRDNRCADIFRKYRNGHDFAKTNSGAMDWAEFDYDDLQEYLEENYEGEFDAIFMDEGGTGGFGEDVKLRGISYVPFYPNQIKSATDNNGEFDPGNKDIRFRQKTKEDYKSEISELKAKLRDSKADIKLLAEQITNVIDGKLKPEIAQEMSKTDISALLRAVKSAVNKESLYDAIKYVEGVLNQVEINKNMKELLALSKLKVKDKNNKGVSVAKTVDQGTQLVMNDIRTSFNSLLINECDREARRFGREASAIEKSLDKISEEEKLIAENKAKELRQKQADMKQQADDLRKERKEESRENIQKRMEYLEEKMDQAVQDGEHFSKDDAAEYDSLPVKLKFIEAQDMASEIEQIDKDMVSLMLNINALKKDRAQARKNGKDVQSFDNKIKAIESEIVEMKQDRLTLQNDLIKLIQEAKDSLKEIIETGKSSLKHFNEIKRERKMQIAKMGVQAVRRDDIKDLNENTTRWEEIKEQIKPSIQMLKSLVMAPLASFNFMLKYIDKNNRMGEGDLYKHFMKSDEGVFAANNRLYKGQKEFKEDVKSAIERIFGKPQSNVFKESKNSTIISIIAENGTVDKKITKGQALYIWLVWRMDDGQAKLKKQGYTDMTMAQIEEFIGENYIRFGEWVTEEFLPELRDTKYNPVHERLFGASMSSREHYFPFDIAKRDIRKDEDVSEETYGQPSTVTGNIINRTRNKNRINTEKSAFEKLLEHGMAMEEWAALAEVRQDFNSLLSNRYFRNLIEANEEGSFEALKKSASVALRSYNDFVGSGWEKGLNKVFKSLNKALAGGAIAFRINTALKQILSYPAFLGYSSDPRFISYLLNATAPVGVSKKGIRENYVSNFKWAVENLPSFEERVELGDTGNEHLRDNTFKLMDKFISVGMLPNRLIDALTCSIGIKAIYDYSLAKYKKTMSEEEAHNLAIYEAGVAFNETQQSSRPEFMAPIQASSHWINKSFTNFQTSNFGFARKWVEAMLNLATRNRMDKQRMYREMVINGNNTAESTVSSNKIFVANQLGDLKNFGLFAFGMNTLWAMGGVGLLGFTASMLGSGGDDDWYNEEQISTIKKGVATAPIMGMIGLGTFLQTKLAGNDYSPIMLFNSLNDMWESTSSAVDEAGVVSYPVAMQILKFAPALVGFNPQTFENLYLGMEGAIKDGNVDLIDVMFMLNSPESQRKAMADKMYKDLGYEEYAKKVSRAYKYLDKKEYPLLPGRKPLTTKRQNEIAMKYAVENLPKEDQMEFKDLREKSRKVKKVAANPDYEDVLNEMIKSIMEE